MTELELTSIVSKAVSEAMARHPQASCPLNQEDFVFLQNLRKKANILGNTIGISVILAVLGGVYFVFELGLAAWKK